MDDSWKEDPRLLDPKKRKELMLEVITARDKEKGVVSERQKELRKELKK